MAMAEIKVPYGQDPYSVIGKYIRDHITAIEDIIAVIEIDCITTNQLFMVNMDEENYFIWNNDWYEGEKDVSLIDFFPVSEAINPSAQLEIGRWIPVSEKLPEPRVDVWVNSDIGQIQGYYEEHVDTWYASFGQGRDYLELIVNAWMPLPKPYDPQESEEQKT